MRRLWCGIAALSLAAAIAAGNSGMAGSGAVAAGDTGTPRPVATPVPPATALAYVSNGQVAVLEAGTLTSAGTGENPAWAPDGSNLLFDVRDLMAGQSTIFIADKHGANTRRLVAHAYAYVNPGWSPDSKYVLYTTPASGTSYTASTIKLQVRAVRVADGATRTLGQFSFGGGCSLKASALQDTFSHAQGSYRGTPSTLLWAQPSLVVVQSSCSGQGLTLIHVGGRISTLAGWSGAVLSPDGKLIAAIVSGGPGHEPKIGNIVVGTGATKVSSAKIAPSTFAWAANSKVLFTVVQPPNSATGLATIYRMSPDAKQVSALGQVQASGVFHLSLNHAQDHLAMAIVASAPANAMAAPLTMVYDQTALSFGPPTPLIPGVQPAWRP